MRKSFGIAIFVALFVAMSGAWAGAITVPDFDFSAPVCAVGGSCALGPNWTGAGGNGFGVQNATGVYTVGTYPTTQFGYANAGAHIQEILTATLAANTVYTLTVDVSAQPGDASFGAIVELLAGSTVLVQATASSPNGNIDPAVGVVQLWTLTYTSGASVTAGQQLEIYLGSTVTQSDYTNVTLSSSPAGEGGTVPEPAMFALVGAGLLGLVARRRFVK